MAMTMTAESLSAEGRNGGAGSFVFDPDPRDGAVPADLTLDSPDATPRDGADGDADSSWIDPGHPIDPARDTAIAPDTAEFWDLG